MKNLKPNFPAMIKNNKKRKLNEEQTNATAARRLRQV